VERAEDQIAAPAGWGRAVAAVAVRPWLWATAVAQIVALAPSGWWRRRPYLPVPDAEYLRFRMQTQYGDSEHEPEPADLITYLKWCRSYRTLLR
jgi:hypothetical protein